MSENKRIVFLNYLLVVDDSHVRTGLPGSVVAELRVRGAVCYNAHN